MSLPTTALWSERAFAADPVTVYAEAVAAGALPAGTLHRLACARHLADLAEGAARGLVFDREAAARAIAFFAKLRHYKGEWAGTRLALQPFQQFLVGSLFGWRREDGLRRFRHAYNEQPRGQGKSTIAAGVALRLGFFDEEPAAEVYFVATKRDQARISYETARQMVLRVPGLEARIEVKQSHLYQAASASKLEPLGANEDTLDGLRPHGIIADEIHAYRNSGILDVMTTGTGTRRQPLQFEITTAGIGRTGVCWDHHDYTSKVVHGLVQDDRWFGCIIGADPEDDWREEATWRKANPNYGVSVKPDDLAGKALQAQHMPAFEAEFRQKHLGQWVQAAERYIPMAQWDSPANAAPFDREALRKQPCIVGLDVSSKFDFTAAVALFKRPDGGYVALPRVWVPEQVVRDSRRALVPLEAWRRQGYLHTTPGNVIDQAAIKAYLRQLAEEFDVREIAYDAWNATALAVELHAEGLPVVEVRQGYRSLSEPTKELAVLVATDRLQHGGHQVLRWMADNLAVDTDPAGNVKPSKPDDRGEGKIDAIVALIMAISRAANLKARPVGPRERGVLVL